MEYDLHIEKISNGAVRLRVWNGWIVCITAQGNDGEPAMAGAYVLDPNHEWQIKSLVLE